MNPENKGPYFPGQKPFFEENPYLGGSECKHFYPDVIRVKDSQNGNGGIRHINCCRCDKTYETSIPHHIISGYNIENRLDEVRNMERKRLANGHC